MSSFLKTQFDKLLVAGLFLVMCGLSLRTSEKVSTFALQTAAGLIGCLVTLVTVKHPDPPKE